MIIENNVYNFFFHIIFIHNFIRIKFLELDVVLPFAYSHHPNLDPSNKKSEFRSRSEFLKLSGFGPETLIIIF